MALARRHVIGQLGHVTVFSFSDHVTRPAHVTVALYTIRCVAWLDDVAGDGVAAGSTVVAVTTTPHGIQETVVLSQH